MEVGISLPMDYRKIINRFKTTKSQRLSRNINKIKVHRVNLEKKSF